jgi:hypothetical protein
MLSIAEKESSWMLDIVGKCKAEELVKGDES